MTQTEGMRPAGLHHVSINVSDVPAARDFYTGVLGLTERTDRPDFGFGGAWLDAGRPPVHLIEADLPPSLGPHLPPAVARLAAPAPEPRRRGIRVTDPVPL